MNYKETYVKPEIAFLLKKYNYNIDKTRYMVNRDGTLVESTNELQKHYNHLELAYNPNAEEVIDYFKKQSIYININKVDDNKWDVHQQIKLLSKIIINNQTFSNQQIFIYEKQDKYKKVDDKHGA